MYVRTPNEVADLIQDLIKDQTVIDLGCGEGEFMKALRVHTSRVSGYEQQTVTQLVATNQGLTVINSDFITQPLADGIVYYAYLNSTDLDRLLQKIDEDNIRATFIIGQALNYTTNKYLESVASEVRSACNGDFKVYILNT